MSNTAEHVSDLFLLWLDEYEHGKPNPLMSYQELFVAWLGKEGMSEVAEDRDIAIDVLLTVLCRIAEKERQQPTGRQFYEEAAAWEFMTPHGFRHEVFDWRRRQSSPAPASS